MFIACVRLTSSSTRIISRERASVMRGHIIMKQCGFQELVLVLEEYGQYTVSV